MSGLFCQVLIWFWCYWGMTSHDLVKTAEWPGSMTSFMHASWFLLSLSCRSMYWSLLRFYCASICFVLIIRCCFCSFYVQEVETINHHVAQILSTKLMTTAAVRVSLIVHFCTLVDLPTCKSLLNSASQPVWENCGNRKKVKFFQDSAEKPWQGKKVFIDFLLPYNYS